MHPVLFEINGWPVYSYGVLLAAAYLAGLQMAVVRARRAGLDAAKVMDFGIYLIIAALVGAKAMLIVVDFNYFRQNPRELLSLARAGGVFYGGLIAAVLVGFWLVRKYKLGLDHGRSRGAGHCARTCHRTYGLPAGRLLLRSTDGCAVGHHVQRSAGRTERRHTARDSAASDAAV
jgi:prolipoprotein diacylglyceryltransferase